MKKKKYINRWGFSSVLEYLPNLYKVSYYKKKAMEEIN